MNRLVPGASSLLLRSLGRGRSQGDSVVLKEQAK